jgi:hypothetical protein
MVGGLLFAGNHPADLTCTCISCILLHPQGVKPGRCGGNAIEKGSECDVGPLRQRKSLRGSKCKQNAGLGDIFILSNKAVSTDKR